MSASRGCRRCGLPWAGYRSTRKIHDAGGDRFRGGYLYAELMGPWGNLRIEEIDGEKVGAEIGMTVQLFNTSYPFHYHHPQEIYMTLTKPAMHRPEPIHGPALG